MVGATRLLSHTRLILAILGAGALIGVTLIGLFGAAAIGHFQEHRSTTRMLLRTATPAGLSTLRRSLTPPSPRMIKELVKERGVGWGVLLANCLAQALITVGVVASLYAGFLNPEFRVTASQLSAVVNGFATILLFALIDPQLSVMTDDVVEGRVSEPLFRRTIVWISLSRLAGTLLAQVLFLPSAQAIAWVANHV